MTDALKTAATQNIRFDRVAVTGGGSNNHTVWTTLVEAGKKTTVLRENNTLAVANGGLKQYPENEADTMRTGCRHLVRDDPLDRKLHPDAFMDTSRSAQPNPRLVLPGMRQPRQLFAKNRVMWLASLPGNRPTSSRPLKMSFPVTVHGKTAIVLAVYLYTQKMPDGMPLLDSDGGVRPEFEPFQLQFAEVDHEWAKYRATTYMHEEEVWMDVEGVVKADITTENASISIELFEPGKKKIACVLRAGIWDAFRTHNTTDATSQKAVVDQRTRSKRRSTRFHEVVVPAPGATSSNPPGFSAKSKDKNAVQSIEPHGSPAMVAAQAKQSHWEGVQPHSHDHRQSLEAIRSRQKSAAQIVHVDEDEDDDYTPSEISATPGDDNALSPGERNELWPRKRKIEALVRPSKRRKSIARASKSTTPHHEQTAINTPPDSRSRRRSSTSLKWLTKTVVDTASCTLDNVE